LKQKTLASWRIIDNCKIKAGLIFAGFNYRLSFAAINHGCGKFSLIAVAIILVAGSDFKILL